MGCIGSCCWYRRKCFHHIGRRCSLWFCNVSESKFLKKEMMLQCFCCRNHSFKDVNLEKNTHCQSNWFIKSMACFLCWILDQCKLNFQKTLEKNYSNQIKKLIDHNQIPLFTWSNYPGLFNLTQIFSPNKDFPFTCLSISISAHFLTFLFWVKDWAVALLQIFIGPRLQKKNK